MRGNIVAGAMDISIGAIMLTFAWALFQGNAAQPVGWALLILGLFSLLLGALQIAYRKDAS